MIPKKDLEGIELLNAMKREFARALKQYRIDIGFSSPFEFSREYSFGRDTIYKYETEQSIPSKAILNVLVEKFGLDKNQREYILELRNSINKLKKELKKHE